MNLLNTTPLPINDELFFWNTSAYKGSNAAFTSDDNILLFARHLLSLISLYSPVKLRSSATVFSKNLDCIPVAPTLPISSLSTKRQHDVLSTLSMSSIAIKDVNAQTLSS